MSAAGRKRCARPASRSLSSIRNGLVASPRRPGAYYQRLRARGKEAKVALVACMRKLIVILNTMLARNQTWNPPTRAAA
jgi:transposase